VNTIDQNNLVNSITHVNNATSPVAIVTYELTRDLMGNLSKVNTQYGSNTSLVKSIGFDTDYQVTSSSLPELPSQASESFTFDSKYNRTSDVNGVYNYDTYSERLNSDPNYTYVYDNNGNLTQRRGVRVGLRTFYTYSSANQLLTTQTNLPGEKGFSQTVSFTYDAIGRRTQKIVSGVAANYTRRYAYDGSNIIAEYDGSNNLLAQYTNGPTADDVLSVNVTTQGVTASLAKNAGSYMYLKDQIGSIVDVTDTNSNRLQHYIYSAYGMILGIQDASGNDISASPVLNTSRTFAGREYDSELALYFNRARFYDPSSGRFISKDPIWPSSGINGYIYGANNPMLYKDSSGLAPITSIEEPFGEITPYQAAILSTGFKAASNAYQAVGLPAASLVGIASASAGVSAIGTASVAAVSYCAINPGNCQNFSSGVVSGVANAYGQQSAFSETFSEYAGYGLGNLLGYAAQTISSTVDSISNTISDITTGTTSTPSSPTDTSSPNNSGSSNSGGSTGGGNDSSGTSNNNNGSDGSSDDCDPEFEDC